MKRTTTHHVGVVMDDNQCSTSRKARKQSRQPTFKQSLQGLSNLTIEASHHNIMDSPRVLRLPKFYVFWRPTSDLVSVRSHVSRLFAGGSYSTPLRDEDCGDEIDCSCRFFVGKKISQSTDEADQ